MFFFFNDTATTEIYTLSLHDALPISLEKGDKKVVGVNTLTGSVDAHDKLEILRVSHQVEIDQKAELAGRSEEHTSELQSRQYLVCRLLLEKKKEVLRLICQLKHHIVT